MRIYWERRSIYPFTLGSVSLDIPFSFSFFLPYFLRFAFLLRVTIFLSLYSRLCISWYSFFYIFLSFSIFKNLRIYLERRSIYPFTLGSVSLDIHFSFSFFLPYFLKFAYLLRETIFLSLYSRLCILSLSFFLYFLKFAYLLRETIFLSLYSRLCISGYSFFFLFLSFSIS